MKTVTGGVIAAEPISLPKAAKLLSGFVSSENGASQGVGAYLRRASAAFTELKSLHVELNSSPLKETRICSDVTHERNPTRKFDAPDRVDRLSQEVKAEINEREKKKKKRKRKSKETIEDGESVGFGKVTGKLKCRDKVTEVEIENENERRKEKKKKRKSDREMHSEEKKSRS